MKAKNPSPSNRASRSRTTVPEASRGARRAPGAVALLTLALAANVAFAEDVNRIVLRVNEEILTLHEYEDRKAGEISTILADQRLDSSQRQERLEQAGRVVMQSTFSEMLLLSFAGQHGIRISDSEVEEAVKTLMERQGIETNDQLQQALASSGMTMEDVRENARRELLWQQVVGREVQPKVKISEEELRAYYRNHQDQFRTPEQRWLKEIIVLESSGLPDTELQRVAGEIRDALATGGEPETVIRPYREQEVTTDLIDLGWLREEELEESLAAAAWALAPGEFSAPIAARGGYQTRLIVREPVSVEDLIMRREYGSRFNRELRLFLSKLEQSAYIVEDLPPESVGYRNLGPDLETEDELELFRAPMINAPEDSGDEAEPADASG